MLIRLTNIGLFLTLLFSSGVLKSQNITIETFYDAEKKILKERYEIKDQMNPLPNGLYESFFSNSSIQSRGYYKNAVPDSLWMYFYENGAIKMSGNLKDGKNYGLWQFFFENGNVNMKGNIYGDRKEGKWLFYYENKQLKSEGSYLNNKKIGVWDYYYENGTLKAKTFYNNGKGTYKEFFEGGELKAIGSNVEGKSDSTWTYYFKDGSIKAIGDYKDGLKNGKWVFYHQNGNKSAEGKYDKGSKDGKWIYYHANGVKSSEGALRGGKKEGYWKLFNEVGLFKAEGVFQQGDGEYREFFGSGNLKIKGHITNGKNEGQWYYYYEDGKLEGECFFNQGEGKYIGYYPDGTLYMKGEIKDGKNVGVWELYKTDGSLAGFYRPYYEGDKPVYKLIEEQTTENVQRGNRSRNYTKPEYKYSTKKFKYFDPVINEFRGVILGTNPLSPIFGSLPISLEYYYQERLGYEMQVSYLRKPFFVREENVDLNQNYASGFDAAIRQKFYHNERKFGMFYFAHELRFTNLTHKANVIDSTDMTQRPIVIDAVENKFEYSILFGNRWMKTYGEKYINEDNRRGITFDIFVGLGIGYRNFTVLARGRTWQLHGKGWRLRACGLARAEQSASPHFALPQARARKVQRLAMWWNLARTGFCNLPPMSPRQFLMAGASRQISPPRAQLMMRPPPPMGRACSMPGARLIRRSQIMKSSAIAID